MFDTPVDKTLQEGLQQEAKIIGLAVRNVLKECHSKPLSKHQMNDVVDSIYMALYSFNYCKKSSSAEGFLMYHANQLHEIEGLKVGFLDGFEG